MKLQWGSTCPPIITEKNRSSHKRTMYCKKPVYIPAIDRGSKAGFWSGSRTTTGERSADGGWRATVVRGHGLVAAARLQCCWGIRKEGVSQLGRKEHMIDIHFLFQYQGTYLRRKECVGSFSQVRGKTNAAMVSQETRQTDELINVARKNYALFSLFSYERWEIDIYLKMVSSESFVPLLRWSRIFLWSGEAEDIKKNQFYCKKFWKNIYMLL